jgi:hypothetical protein
MEIIKFIALCMARFKQHERSSSRACRKPCVPCDGSQVGGGGIAVNVATDALQASSPRVAAAIAK